MRKHITVAVVIALFSLPHFALAVDLDAARNAGFGFLESQLLDSSGGIYANLLTTYPEDANAGVNHQMLSEYAGLAMEYAVYVNDQDFFSGQHGFVSGTLFSDISSLFMWRVGPNLEVIAASSASIDDLRIIDGYIQAYEKWGTEEYFTSALNAATALKAYAFVDGVLTQGTSWDNEGVYASSPAIISYIDLPAMKRLAQYDSSWTDIEQTQAGIVAGSAIENGLFWQEYDIATQEYSADASLNSIQQAITAVHLAEAGYTELAQESLDFYKNAYATDGRIYDSYEPDGDPAGPNRDFSVYSLVASLALFLGDDEFADDLLQFVAGLQTSNPESIYNGAFQWSEGDRVYSFVQLNVLRTLGQRNPVVVVEPEQPVDEPSSPSPDDPSVSDPAEGVPDNNLDTPVEDAPLPGGSDDTTNDPAEDSTPTPGLQLGKTKKGRRTILQVTLEDDADTALMEGKTIRFYRKTKKGKFILVKKKKMRDGVAEITVRKNVKITSYQARFRPITESDRESVSAGTIRSNIVKIWRSRRYGG